MNMNPEPPGNENVVGRNNERVLEGIPEEVIEET